MGVTADAVVWHDVECGSYEADLPLWRELAAAARGPVLDLGAGTGRVALDLARRGHEVHALDVDPVLLAALRERAAGLPVHAHVGDARDVRLGASPAFALAIAPMQTAQLLGGPGGRAGMFAGVRRHLRPGGVLALAVADVADGFDEEEGVALVPDMREVGGVVYASRPTAILPEDDGFVLHRLREKVTTDGTRDVSGDRTRLDRLPPDVLEREARAAGYAVLDRRTVTETEDHVASTVVMLRG